MRSGKQKDEASAFCSLLQHAHGYKDKYCQMHLTAVKATDSFQSTPR